MPQLWRTAELAAAAGLTFRRAVMHRIVPAAHRQCVSSSTKGKFSTTSTAAQSTSSCQAKWLQGGPVTKSNAPPVKGIMLRHRQHRFLLPLGVWRQASQVLSIVLAQNCQQWRSHFVLTLTAGATRGQHTQRVQCEQIACLPYVSSICMYFTRSGVLADLLDGALVLRPLRHSGKVVQGQQVHVREARRRQLPQVPPPAAALEREGAVLAAQPRRHAVV